MTSVEAAIYDYLIAYQSIYKKLPTNKELAYQFNVDRSVINKHLLSLVEQGHLERIQDVQFYRLT
jgi:predicted transcriptional regulator